MTLRILAEAEEDLRASVEWYESRRVGLGVALLGAVRNTLLDIEAHPLRHEKIAAKGPKVDVRRCSVARFPFVVIYEIRQEESVILAIAHNKRRPGYWAARRLDR